MLHSRSQVRIPLGANNFCDGSVHREYCFGFNWAPPLVDGGIGPRISQS